MSNAAIYARVSSPGSCTDLHPNAGSGIRSGSAEGARPDVDEARGTHAPRSPALVSATGPDDTVFGGCDYGLNAVADRELWRIRVTWVFAVVSERNKVEAISAFGRPRARSMRTSRFRSMSAATPSGTVPGAGRATTFSSSLRIIAGASIVSPAATVGAGNRLGPQRACGRGLHDQVERRR